MNSRKMIAVAALAIVIVAGIGWTVMTLRGRALPSKEVLATIQERIDSETLELISLPIGDWLRLGEKDGRFKSPKTGKYTMVIPLKCHACGAKIPTPITPVVKTKEDFEARGRIWAEYRCPKCGKSPL